MKKVNKNLGLELAWGLIANAYYGDWNKAPKNWREAAENWRDKYWHGTLNKNSTIDKGEDKCLEN